MEVKGAGSFILGVIVGSLAIGIYRRMEERLDEENDMELAERMRRYMGELEARTAKIAPTPKAAPKNKAPKPG